MMRLLRKALKANSILSLGGNLAGAGLGFLSFILLAKGLEKESFGNWMIYITSLTFVEMFRSGILHTALVRFYSGAITGKERDEIAGSSWSIGLGLSLVVVAVLLITNLFVGGYPPENGFVLFVKWYPLFCLAALPYYFSTWIQQAEQRFDVLAILKVLPILPFVIFLLANLWMELPIQTVLMVHIGCFFFGSLISTIAGWSSLMMIFKAQKARVKELMQFGKYSMGTLIGANLLKSSDTFIIAWLLGPAAVALYSVPIKLIEVIEIPLRSVVATVLPRMSALSIDKHRNKITELFNSQTGMLTLLLIPFLIGCFIFAEEFVVLMGGEDYRESANILRIFLIYGAFLPMDRMIGITLDSINMPKFNLIKVVLMVGVNVIGDIFVLLTFGTLEAVAIVTIMTALSGILAGGHFLNKVILTRVKDIMYHGYQEVLQIWIVVTNKIPQKSDGD